MRETGPNDREADQGRRGNYALGLVSIIIPVFDRLPLLGETLASVSGTTYRPLEIVVADDGSIAAADIAAAVQAFARAHPDLKVNYLALPHGGAIAARNAGLAASSGEFVFYLDSDDLLTVDGLADMVGAMADTSLPYCVGQLVEEDLAGNRIAAEGHADPVLDCAGVVASQWPTIVGLYRRRTLDRLGAFDDSLEFGADKEFLWRIVAGSSPGLLLPVVVSIRRNHGLGQLTDGYSTGVMGRHTVAALDAFAAWADREGLMRPAIAKSVRPRLWLATVRVGSAGMTGAVAQASALSARLDAAAPDKIGRWVMAVLARVPRTGHVLTVRALNLGRRGLHAWRNLRRRISG